MIGDERELTSLLFLVCIMLSEFFVIFHLRRDLTLEFNDK